jgi:hypothetical protein
VETDDDTIQCIFDFDGGCNDGFANFRREQEEFNHAIGAAWLLPVGRRVRVVLRDCEGEFTGRLVAVDPAEPFDRRQPLKLRIGHSEFIHTDIAACTVLDD